ncbi:hypothetical protein [Mycobacterium arosiense]|uniref:Uncharacterized protein n=1 Tax=Mycobacterium arosiense ATCC BAA-1401 = DSM 45069 TaxID=1265311 RepID=A0A1W9Z606_MYCAI|nr:hypothetical protein [Mycobacterium arosiense]ORA07756.1 hypothetical protein BST14_26400 [Mycobacterium arosiense ATCC BAA-1401 = DSM 45069]
MTDDLTGAAETTAGAAADPTDALPTLMQGEARSLAWADDDLEDDPVRASWGTVFNYAAALLVCGLIAAAITAAVVWFGQ